MYKPDYRLTSGKPVVTATGPSRKPSIGLQVDQLDAAMTALTEQGVVFAPQVIDDAFIRIAFFGDPDRNPLYLCEVEAAHP
jgi:hypothetical protein